MLNNQYSVSDHEVPWGQQLYRNTHTNGFSSLRKILLIIIYMTMCFASTMCAQYFQRPEEGTEHLKLELQRL